MRVHNEWLSESINFGEGNSQRQPTKNKFRELTLDRSPAHHRTPIDRDLNRRPSGFKAIVTLNCNCLGIQLLLCYMLFLIHNTITCIPILLNTAGCAFLPFHSASSTVAHPSTFIHSPKLIYLMGQALVQLSRTRLTKMPKWAPTGLHWHTIPTSVAVCTQGHMKA